MSDQVEQYCPKCEQDTAHGLYPGGLKICTECGNEIYPGATGAAAARRYEMARLSDKDKADIIRRVQAGDAVAVIAVDFGCSEQTVRNTIKKAGKPSKSPAEAPTRGKRRGRGRKRKQEATAAQESFINATREDLESTEDTPANHLPGKVSPEQTLFAMVMDQLLQRFEARIDKAMEEMAKGAK